MKGRWNGEESLMLTRTVMVLLLAGLFAAGTLIVVQAQQPISESQAAANRSGQTFDIAPYAWFANINKTATLSLPPALGRTATTDPSVGFGQIMSHLNFATMIRRTRNSSISRCRPG